MTYVEEARIGDAPPAFTQSSSPTIWPGTWYPLGATFVVVDTRFDWTLTAFDLTLPATLARELHEADRLSAFFDLIQQDPVVSQVKLIAEPWDVGEGGYQVGNFPALHAAVAATTELPHVPVPVAGRPDAPRW